MIKKLKGILLVLRHYIVYIFVSIFYPFVNVKKYKILSDDETIDKIINEKISIARYGDGEFKWMLGIKQRNFQDDNVIMQEKLIEVIKSDDANLLIGIPSMINSFDDYTFDAKRYWKKFLLLNYRRIKCFLSTDKIYCDAYISRPYIDRKDKTSQNIRNSFNNIRRIWEKKEIIIVEGENSRLGVDNDLFKNASKIERIICPASNAFEKYDEIFASIKELASDKLVILSLGPTATILAWDLSKSGIQAIDIGHIDIEYMWYKNKSKKKEKINGRIVNEILENDELKDVSDKKYYEQIIKRIKGD